MKVYHGSYMTIDEIDLAMQEMEQYEYDADGGLAVWLQDAALRMDFAAIAEKLASLPL